MTHPRSASCSIRFAVAATLAVALTLVSSGCATTGSGTSHLDSLKAASAEECAIISMTLELFPRPEDGSPLKVSDVAQAVTPSFRPQRPDQVGSEPLSLKACQAIRTTFVSGGTSVVLGRPEIHDDRAFVRYREGEYSPVFAELERQTDGNWRHVAAYPVGY